MTADENTWSGNFAQKESSAALASSIASPYSIELSMINITYLLLPFVLLAQILEKVTAP